MAWFFVVMALLVVYDLSRIATHTSRLATHHERFPAPGQGPQIGDEIWIRSFGVDQQCEVIEIAPDGAILVQPTATPGIATGDV